MGGRVWKQTAPPFFCPLDKLVAFVHTPSIAKLQDKERSNTMANGKQPTELTVEGVTLVFSGFVMPAKTTGKGSSKNDLIVAAIRDNAIPGQPVWMQGTKISAIAGLKKKYSDIHFETRGGKENPSVYATLRGELVDA